MGSSRRSFNPRGLDGVFAEEMRLHLSFAAGAEAMKQRLEAEMMEGITTPCGCLEQYLTWSCMLPGCVISSSRRGGRGEWRHGWIMGRRSDIERETVLWEPGVARESIEFMRLNT